MRRRATAFLLLTLLILSAMSAWAYPTGITGVTRKTGGSGCSPCHTGSSIDGVVTISGPTTLRVGQTGTYTLTIGSGTLIGCDIAASSGTLTMISSALQRLNGELTHSQKMSSTSVQFTWSPSDTGAQTLYAVGARTSKSGGWGHANDFSVKVTSNSLAGVEESRSPSVYSLDQNFPNPFNPSTTIRFTLPQAAEVSLTIMNLIGEKVATLVSHPMEQGAHAIQWNASGLPSGVYLYRLEAYQGSVRTFVETRKLLLIK